MSAANVGNAPQQVVEFLTGNPQLGVWAGQLALFCPSGEQGITANGSLPPEILPSSRRKLLGILSAPAHMIPTEVLHFLAPLRSDIENVRILRRRKPSSCSHAPAEYIVLLQMSTQEAADTLFLQYDGKLFSCLEEAQCNVVFVADVDYSSGELPALSSSPSPSAASPIDASEVCVICMERIVDRFITTVCNHTFHIDCLIKWTDSPCPVCRFHHDGAGGESTCEDCSCSSRLWVCLICGFVGCGAEHSHHIRNHYLTTLHTYALDIETQQVWDFAGDGFVHRLIHNRADGKLVEVPDPLHTSAERPQQPASLSDPQEERLVHTRLEGLARQYNGLVAGHLEEQRRFYEKQMDRLLEEQENERKSSSDSRGQAGKLLAALRHERKHVRASLMGVEERLKKVEEENGFLTELNRSLESNKLQLTDQLASAQLLLSDASEATSVLVPQLEEKVASLMAKLDSAP